jgi:hypothetical protein
VAWLLPFTQLKSIFSGLSTSSVADNGHQYSLLGLQGSRPPAQRRGAPSNSRPIPGAETTFAVGEEVDEESYEMVATYGVARENDVDASYREGSDESRALLGGTSGSGTPAVPSGKRDGHATMMSCIGNLANTIIGSGM